MREEREGGGQGGRGRGRQPGEDNTEEAVACPELQHAFVGHEMRVAADEVAQHQTCHVATCLYECVYGACVNACVCERVRAYTCVCVHAYTHIHMKYTHTYAFYD